MISPRVRFRSITRYASDGGLSGREIARLAWLHLIARPEQHGRRGLFALAVADRATRNEARYRGQVSGALQRFRDAASRVSEEDWRSLAARLRRSGTIPA